MLGVRDIDIAQLTLFPGNARRGQLDEIRKSVRRLGQYRSVVVRVISEPPAFVVLAGNHTIQAMQAEGHQTAHCGLIRCTDDEARRVNIADNRLSDISTEDPDQLAELLSYLDEDYEGTGWAAEDVAKLIDPPHFTATPEDEQPGPSEKPPMTCPSCGVEFIP
jgi:ParB-like chromosome segregation protein Spo0J